ncbi:MAG: peptidoglycan editing factor PgeF [Saprospiraceae bacterium]|nr:peptidoglycan editing factor PgeF [Saprospiraceae bacterium]
MQAASFRRAAIFDSFPGLIAGESTRHGGVSRAPYYSLNLGKSTDDHPERVAENRRLFAAAAGFDLAAQAWSYQVHGDRIRLVTEPGGAEGYDAMISATPGIVLSVTVADCVPVLIYDPENRAFAAVHAGWRGTAFELVSKTLAAMSEAFGTRGADCFAFIGTCIDECSFEVGEDVAQHFSSPFKRFDALTGKFFVDLKKANAAQLMEAGLPEGQIGISPYCTVRNNADYFSHRADKGTTGRMLSVIGWI